MKTVNLELSKQLKEAGYPQGNSTWIWGKEVDPSNPGYCDEVSLILSEREYDFFPLYASPTADEILEQLPAQIKNKRLQIDKMPAGEFCISYIPFNESDPEEIVIMGTTPTLADAAAKMWLYLKERRFTMTYQI